MSVVRVLAVAVGLLVGVACEQSVIIEAEIEIPLEVQQAITYPAQVAFRTDFHEGTSISFCGVEEDSIFFLLTDDDPGCAQPMLVTAVIGPFAESSTGCVEEPGNAYNAVAAGEIWATAIAPAFEDASAIPCKGGEDRVDLVMALGSTAP